MKKLDKETLYQLYVVDKKSMHKIATDLGVAVGTVFNYIKKYKIKTRPQHKGFLGKTHTKETREKISKGNKGKVITLEQRKKMAEAHKLKKVMGRKNRRVYCYFLPQTPL